tara:strand:+ start:359 stop:583 length:225 start_codon:yes stop_codon:yes gene_type:complete
MTPKEKAKELVQIYFNEVSDANPLEDILFSAKQCALICVDEMVSYLYDIEFHKREDAIKSVKYWKEVEQEINKI